MLAIERKNEILAILQKEQRVLVSELSKRYDVTDETIRRDLEKLEDFYWHGYEEAERLYPQLHEWLEKREECVSRKRLLR